MKFVVTALVAGTIGVFSLLTEGGWIRAGTTPGVASENTPPEKSRKPSFRYHHFHDVEGITVENIDGEEIGTIKDLIVEPKSGRPKYVIIKSGGAWLGGRRLIPVPTSAIAVTTAKVGIAAIDITRQQWKHAPAFSKRELRSLEQSGKGREIARFYERAERVAHGSHMVDRRTEISSTGRETGLAPALRENEPYELASDLINKQVVARRGSEVGKLADLMVDFAGDKPTLGIISADQIPGAGDRFAVPVQLLSLAQNQKIAVNVERSAFEHARPVGRHNLTDVVNKESNQIFRYER